VIETGDANPVKVPPCPIPFHYVDKVHNQIWEMAQEGIIRPSNSPWCAPAVYVPKSNGELHICIDFVQLNQMQFPGLRGHSSSLQENVSSPSLNCVVLIGSSPWTIIQLRRLHFSQDQAMDSGSSQ